MKHIAPDYYGQFRCIADRCRHSCCIGWEIGIDRETRERYRRMDGPFGQRLNAAIDEGEEGSVFRMGKDGRCPMLAPNGLCDLITEKGEEALCQICADHPRFRSFFTGRTETGLGLCCEAAALLILGQERPVRLVSLMDDGADDAPDADEAALLALREACMAILQDRRIPVNARLDRMLEQAAPTLQAHPDAALFRALERLDPAWDQVLDTLDGGWHELPELAAAYEQFAVYLLYRHLPGAMEDGDVEGRIGFCALNTRLLMAICHAHAVRHGACSLEACADYARMWSAEIEYDEENVNALLDAFWEE